jgi:hypothetical protein
MHIAIVAKELPPYVENTMRGAEIATLAEEFISRGHSVCAIIPFPLGRDLYAHSLARRLNPISFERNSEKKRCIRYDGRTSSGVAVHLLEIEGLCADTENDVWEAADTEAFCAAACALLSSLGQAFDWCLSFDSEASLVPAISKSSDSGNQMDHMLVVTTLKGDLAALAKGLLRSDQVVIANREAAFLAESRKIEPLANMIADGSASTFSRPCGSFKPLGLDQKASLKAAFQFKTGLPIRDDAPLVLFAEPDVPPFFETLKSFLKGNVQVAAFSAGGGLKDLTGLYRDRLAVVEAPGSLDDALGPMDACVVGSNVGLVEKALLWSVVPVVGSESGFGLVDLEPSCESGSGIVVDELTEPLLVQGLNRLAAAYSYRSAFKSLAARLPGYVATWAKVADHYLQIMEDKDKALLGA